MGHQFKESVKRRQWISGTNGFLKLKQIDDYNNTMGGVDRAYQFRGAYQTDHWICNRKWWWAIWDWSFGVHLVNTYIMFINQNVQEGQHKKDLLLYHDFRKSIALSWIDPEDVHYSKVI